MDALSITFLMLAVVSLGATVYFGIEARRIRRKIKTLEWDDIIIAVRDISRSIKADAEPDVIYSPDQRGGIISYLMKYSLDAEIPIITGVTLWKDDFPEPPDWPHYVVTETSKWWILVPNILTKFKNNKIMIVDDFAMSGDALIKIKTILSAQFLFPHNNIKTCAIIVTDIAKKAHKDPSYYWKVVESTDFFFPWGRAR